ncbi:MAG: UDP-N-acetylmuramate dehydrogenase [Lachnospiraceae bacterium]|nr:UDP-N-acetylmuramate dehydrogenase [Lachnospiraceae bacterium]
MESFFEKQLEEIAGEGRVLVQEELAGHTTFRVGGPADYYVRPQTPESLCRLVWYLKETERDFFVMGNGSNLLVSDLGYRGTVVDVSGLDEIRIEGTEIYAQAGALLSKAAQMALSAGLTGLEFASGIPGSIGGALVMNAGAYGSEMADVTREVILVGEDGTENSLSGSDMQFGYRTSICRKGKGVVSAARISLKPGDKTEIEEKMKELALKRKSRQPLEYPSAGSTFKRPEGYYAGKLIMDAGLPGYTIGGAQVSPKHCGFIINTGRATAADIYDLIMEVREKVGERFGVELEPEVCIIGDF